MCGTSQLLFGRGSGFDSGLQICARGTIRNRAKIPDAIHRFEDSEAICPASRCRLETAKRLGPNSGKDGCDSADMFSVEIKMRHNAIDAYLESRILSADPIELVNVLYQTCTGAVREARHHLESDDVVARSRSITFASGILLELVASLDQERGGAISQRLGDLYNYMLRQLMEANFKQSDAPLAEVLGLLSTLAEAWEGLKAQEKPAAIAESRWAQPRPHEAAPAYAAQGWSF
jgi:flagellar protein FliS